MDALVKGRKIALIGGAGFIGHNLALELVRMGASVDILDSLQVNSLGALAAGKHAAGNAKFYMNMILQRLDLLRANGINLHTVDARDYHGLSATLNQIEPQVVVHLAAVSHAGRSNKDPFSTFDHSLRTLENALDWARVGAEQFIFFSSSMIYGHFHGRDVTEDLPLDPIGIYGALKFSGEKIVQAYKQVFDLDYTIIRPSALYGPRCVSRRVVQIFIENALAGQPLTINGDGEEKLDFTYIDDLVQGICLAIAKPEARNQVFNLTYGSSRSILDLTKVLEAYFPGLRIEKKERDRLMPVRGTLSVDKARTLLGYQPAFPIEKGVEQYMAWYRDFAHGWDFNLDAPLRNEPNGLS